MPDPLPEELSFGPFSVREALAHGMRRGQLRRRELITPFRGIRSSAVPEGIVELCRAYQAGMPRGQFYSHSTAARLFGIPLPASKQDELHVSSYAPAKPPRRAGVVGHRLSVDSVELQFLGDFVVTSPADTWYLLGGLLGHDDLVIAGDHLVGGDLPLATLPELASSIEKHAGMRGTARLRRAFDDIRMGSESPKETELRLLLQRAGLPEPELNVDIHDDSGRWIARGDQVHRRHKVLVEYDGDQHRTSRRQYVRDVRRLEELAHAGWLVVHVLKEALDQDPADVIRRVDRALRSRGWRPRPRA